MKTLTEFAAGWVLGVLLPAGGLWAQEKIEAISRPSEDVILSFVRPGRIADVLVKEGERVKKGDDLIRQDSVAEMIQLEQLKAQAEDETRLKAAEAQLAQRRVDLKEKEEALSRGAATPMEVEHAKLEVTIAELTLALTCFEGKQDQRKYREARAQIDRMRLVSPINGIVERVLVEPGESADAMEKILQVVNIDPLWIDVPVPLGAARRLKKGTKNALVEFENADGPPLQVPGNITHIAAVADPASGTLTVRVEAPNAKSRPAGERVYVSFPPAKTAQTPRAHVRQTAARSQ